MRLCHSIFNTIKGGLTVYSQPCQFTLKGRLNYFCGTFTLLTKSFTTIGVGDQLSFNSHCDSRNRSNKYSKMTFENVVKSANDTREYRVISLANGLRALLISDLQSLSDMDAGEDESEGEEALDADDDSNESEDDDDDDDAGDCSEDDGPDAEIEPDDDKPRKKKKKSNGKKLSAAALCIGAGSFSDPPHLPGLAHFLEHMVFMGSEKYPDENEFDAFIKKHGGSNNAYTDCERTVFYFDIQQKDFEEGLDRFAQFVVQPLMKKDSVERELKAVDSEWNMSVTSDRFRKEQLLGSFAKPGHPMSKFMWGNIMSLKETPESQNVNPHDDLRDFYSKVYSAHYMTLAVQARETLNTLEEWVTTIFSDVPNNGKPQPNFSNMQDPFATEAFTKLYKVIPVKSFHEVELTWCLPSMLKHYKVKPIFYLDWLVGHEGKGSILSYLKSKYWASALNSGNSENGFEHNTTWACFSISVDLTDDGMNHIYEVLCAIFEYLNMLRDVGPQERIFGEIQTIEHNSFCWKEQSDPVEYVENLCENMQRYPPEHYITGEDLLYDYDPELISHCLSYLEPRKANIIMTSKQFETQGICNKTEKWYSTKYAEESVPEEWLKIWESSSYRKLFHLPVRNVYIATDFSLKENESRIAEHPVLLSDTSLSRLWYKKDEHFKVPKAYIHFKLQSPVFNQTPLAACMFDTFLRALEHNLDEVAYAADVAHLSYSLRGTEKALIIKVHGFSDKLPRLFETIIEHIANFNIQQELLDSTIDQLHKIYYNEYIKPNVLVRDLRLQLLQDRYWTTIDKRHFLPVLTVDLLQAFVHEFRCKLRVEGLVHGNLTSADALALEKRLLHTLCCTSLPANVMPELRVVSLPVGQTVYRVRNLNTTDNNSVLTNYYQHGPASLLEAVTNEMLVMMMEEPVFDVLRTREQLGYTVYCTNRNTAGIVAFSVSVCSQADKFSMDSLDSHIEKFLLEYEDMLENTSEESFVAQKSALITLKQCEDTHLGEEVERHWAEISDHTYLFDRLQKEVQYLEQLTREDVIAWFKSHIPTSGAAKKLSVQVVGSVTADVAMDTSDNVSVRQSSLSSSPQLETLPTDDYQNSVTDIKAFKDRLYLYPVSKIIH